jgi:hypothetical protein
VPQPTSPATPTSRASGTPAASSTGFPGAPSMTPSATPVPPPLSVANGTDRVITISVNDIVVATVPATSGLDPIETPAMPRLPWSISIQAVDGFVLATASMENGQTLAMRRDLSCGRIDVWSRGPILGPMNGPGEPGDCGPAGLKELLAKSTLQFEPLAAWSDAPQPKITAAAATKTAQAYANVSGMEAVYVGRGRWHRLTSTKEYTVWLVITRITNAAPMPVGPACPPPGDSCQTWAVMDYSVVEVSDQSGDVLGSFATMREVDPPASPSPSGY